MSGSNGSSTGGLVGGVDGVRGGWVMAVIGVEPRSQVCISVWRSFADLWSRAHERGLRVVGVDIPIGLPDTTVRTADGEAPALLKPGRTSSVFNAPPLCTLEADKYEDALKRSRDQTGRGLSRQSYALRLKIKEVRDVLEAKDLLSGACPQAAEVHPEVSFRVMADQPMSFHKSRQAGVAERLVLLRRHFPNIVDAAVWTGIAGCAGEGHDKKLTPGLDDVLDAVAAAWTARRLIQREATKLGGCEKDPDGYPMNIWA